MQQLYRLALSVSVYVIWREKRQEVPKVFSECAAASAADSVVLLCQVLAEPEIAEILHWCFFCCFFVCCLQLALADVS